MLQKRASSCRAPPHVQQRVADAAAAILEATPAPSLIRGTVLPSSLWPPSGPTRRSTKTALLHGA